MLPSNCRTEAFLKVFEVLRVLLCQICADPLVLVIRLLKYLDHGLKRLLHGPVDRPHPAPEHLKFMVHHNQLKDTAPFELGFIGLDLCIIHA